MKNRIKGISTLCIASILWGGEFVVEKDVLNYIEPNWSNAIRFFICSVFSILIWKELFLGASVNEWKKGLISGGFMGLGFAFQTMGLEFINAGVNAVLCAAYLLVIPLFVWKIENKRPSIFIMFCALFAFIGVYIMSVQGNEFNNFYLGRGEILTLIGSVFYAGAIVSVDYYAQQMDSRVLAGMQFIATFIISICFALLFEEIPTMMPFKVGVEFIYLIIGASLCAQLLFTYGMKYVTSALAGNIFLLESVSAMILGIIFLKEQINSMQAFGSGMILVSIIVLNKYECRNENN